MSVPRITDRQKDAVKNLMFSTENIEFVLHYMRDHGKRYVGEMSIGEAKDLISALVEGI